MPASVFKRLYWIYLAGFLLAATGDNLQGSYRYALFDSYGISHSVIELLQVSSYGSSLVVGTFAASLADRYGRRWSCLLCVLLYGLYCFLLNFSMLWILAVATVFWGVANAFYHTGFEAWLIQEHRDRSLDDQSLKRILRDGYVGTALVSVGTGVLAQLAVGLAGYAAPFNIATLFFLLTALFIWQLWSENYGAKEIKPIVSFVSAARILRADPRIVLLGLSSAFFEASLYIFVIEWTPTLRQASDSTNQKSLPLGLIFSVFMLFDMVGSFIFYPLAQRIRVQTFTIVVFLVAAIALSAPMFAPKSLPILFAGFLLFEFCVGIYRPSAGFMRSQYIPNEVRATMMSFIRVPQIILMLIIFLCHFSLSVVFILCSCFNLLALICMIILRNLRLPEEQTHIGEGDLLLDEPPSPLAKSQPTWKRSSSSSSLLPQTSMQSDDQ